MNDEECYVAKLNGILKHNCDIIRKDYSFARKYDKCLIKVENAKSILNTQKSERNNLIAKLKTCTDSIDALSLRINETDSEIGRTKKEIEALTDKNDRICNDIMMRPCSLSYDDELKILQRQLTLVLLNTLKYSEEIDTMATGFESQTSNGPHEQHLEDGQWSQFLVD